MAETKKIALTTGSYTAISTAGQLNVTFKLYNCSYARMVIATSPPSASVDDYYESDPGMSHSLSNLGASDIVYVMPENAGSAGAYARVARGA